MIKQGGYLLWNVPTIYGFLNYVVLYLVPVVNVWFKFYLLNSFLKFVFSLIVFHVILDKKNIYWYFYSIILSWSLLFLLPAGQTIQNYAGSPSSGPIHFFPLFLLLYSIFYFKNFTQIKQNIAILPIWLIGIFWSFESLYFCSLTILAYIIMQLKYNNYYYNKFIFIIYPLSLLILCIIINLFYSSNDIDLDIEMFYESAISYSKDFNARYGPILIDLNGGIWIFFYLISLIIKFHLKNKKKYAILTIIGLWSISIYYISGSQPLIISHLLIYYLFFY